MANSSSNILILAGLGVAAAYLLLNKQSNGIPPIDEPPTNNPPPGSQTASYTNWSGTIEL